jgi:hypothetical protein
MKYVSLLLGVALIYYVFVRNSHVDPVVKEVTASEVAPLTTGPRETKAAATPQSAAGQAAHDALKKPLDRTRAVLDQVKQRNGNGEF